MNGITLHRSGTLSGSGIKIKFLSPTLPDRPIDYVHRDDYFGFGMVTSGKCTISIDFRPIVLEKGDLICICPYQVHDLMDKGDAEGMILSMDAVLLDDEGKRALARYSAHPEPFRMDDTRYSELKSIIALLSGRKAQESPFVQHLACAAAAIIIEALPFNMQDGSNGQRHAGITASLRRLVAEDEHPSADVGRYADAMHISAVYLNEAVRETTGMSVKEIAWALGFGDYAYFSRLFKKETGATPSGYRLRQKNGQR